MQWTCFTRYVRWVSFNYTTLSSNISDVYAEEFYDLTTDPNEDHNVISSSKETAKLLYKTLFGYVEWSSEDKCISHRRLLFSQSYHRDKTTEFCIVCALKMAQIQL